MKKEYLKYIVLLVFVIVLMILGMHPDSLFGSSTDWFNQHTVFPEYFRNLFYTTHQLIPSFAFSIGAGQNIFHFSYYGLLNPIILLSYALPFIDMTTYLQIANVILLISSAFLFFYWMKQKPLSSFSIWLSTLLFVSATPLIFQAHRHFMFVDYMPFLLMGLLAIDRYFKTGKKALISLSIFLMIMTSYYYSIGGLFVLAIYYIYQYLQHRSFSLKTFLKDGVRFLIPYITGILMAGVLLLPTAYVVLHGRGDSHGAVSLWEILLPKFDYQTLLYDSYGLGLTFVSMLSIIFVSISSKKEQRFLGIVCGLISIFPIFMYLLNGGLYVRSKVLIPFLPLFLMITGYFIDNWCKSKNEHHLFKWLPWMLLLGFISILLYQHEWYYAMLFLVDIILTVLLLELFQKTKKQYLLYGLVLLSCIVSIITNQTETYVTKEKYQKINQEEMIEEIELVNQTDTSFYRMKQLKYNLPILNKIYTDAYHQTTLYSSTQNMNYYQFYRTYFGNSIANRNNLMISSTSNLLFDTFMGVKYTVGEENSFGYQKVPNTEDIYQNPNALPIMYATSHTVSESEFDQLQYPYQSDILLKNAVVSSGNSHPVSDIKKVKLDSTIQNAFTNAKIKQKDSYVFSLQEDQNYQVHFDQDLTKQILLLQFDIKNKTGCEKEDRFITINGKTNKVTCDDWLYANENYQFRYVIAEEDNPQDLFIVIGKGDYEIQNIEVFLLDYESIENVNEQVDPIVIDQANTQGDVIKGHITVTTDGYFVTSIPYDEGFEILVDGTKVSYERVNKGFVGFPIPKGEHDIVFVYHAPWLKEGKIMSIVAFFLFCVLVGWDRYLPEKERKD